MSTDLRRYLDLVEASETYQSPIWDNRTYELHHNPTPDEFLRLFEDSDMVVRALIDDDGDLWVWDAELALHSDIDSIQSTSKFYAFTIFNNNIDAQKSPKPALRRAIKHNPTLVALDVPKMRMTSSTL